MVSWEVLAKKIYNIIIEKRPSNLAVTFYDGKWRIYTDEGLIEEIGEEIQIDKETEEIKSEASEEEKPRVKKARVKKAKGSE